MQPPTIAAHREGAGADHDRGMVHRPGHASRSRLTGPRCGAAVLARTVQTAHILARKRPPKQAPPLKTVIRLIAGLGGFLGRKRSVEPCMKPLWLGLQRVRDSGEGMLRQKLADRLLESCAKSCAKLPGDQEQRGRAADRIFCRPNAVNL